jgi:hypothetical protein
MPEFCVSQEPQPTGEHEVHAENCPAWPTDNVSLGWHRDCQGAVRDARIYDPLPRLRAQTASQCGKRTNWTRIRPRSQCGNRTNWTGHGPAVSAETAPTGPDTAPQSVRKPHQLDPDTTPQSVRKRTKRL